MSDNPELRSGDTGSVVEYLQTLIANPAYGLGFGAVTGVFDEATVAAVMELQRRHYLPGTGVVDSATWDMLEGRTTDQAIPSDNRYLQYGDRGDAVEYLQRLLASPVYGVGYGDVTAEFDDATLSAVRDFQQRHHLTPSGVVDGAMWEALEGHSPADPSTQILSEAGDQMVQGPELEGTQFDIAALQWRLRVFGYNVESTGAYDDATTLAIGAFQADHQLPQTGTVDADTWAWIDWEWSERQLPSEAPLEFPIDGSSDVRLVRTLQDLLHSIGYQVETTGTWDTPTSLAVQYFQTNNHLPSTGVVDADTWAALDTASKHHAAEEVGELPEFHNPQEYLEYLAHSSHALSTTSDILGGFISAGGTEESFAASALEWAGGIGEIIGTIAVLHEVYAAFGQDEDQQERIGFCFGCLWEALGYEDLVESFDWAGDDAAKLREAFASGVASGRGKLRSDVAARNKLMILLAVYRSRGDSDPELHVLNDLWHLVKGHYDQPESLSSFPKG